MGISIRSYKVALLTIGLSVSGFASAAMVTLPGNDVAYTFDDSSLFGDGFVVGNSLMFQPADFKAVSENGAGVVSASQTLIIGVAVTTVGYHIGSLELIEVGDYTLNGTGATVTASGRLGVMSTTTTCGIFACYDSSIFNAGPFAETGVLSEWSDGTSINLADTAGWISDTSLSISLQNNLSATTLNTGEYAFIQKKLVGVGIPASAVPVPAAVWLFASGLFGLAAMVRRIAS